MIVAKIQVSGAIARTLYKKVIPAGIVGAQVEFEYDTDVWKGLHKTVVFRGPVTKDVVTDENIVTIPKEVAEKPRSLLIVGVYGVDAEGNLAIPTVWADLGIVRESANPSGDTTTDPSLPVWAQIQGMIGNLDELDTEAKNNLVAAVNEALAKGGAVDEAEIRRIVGEYLATNPPTVTETDPTVPAWAKQPTKPAYTAAEVGALPDTYTPPNQTAQQVGADPAGTAASAVSQHNVDTAAHNDLRLALQELANRVNAALDSDDTTLDQMSEVVAYIKSNKSLIDAITTSKVSVADIVNDLVTNAADKPLSAAQGVVVKQLIDALHKDKLDAAELTNAVNTALAQAKASGEFDGADGATPNIQIGTVDTLPAGSPATASMGGTAENPILNLGIPQGASGSEGSGIAVSGATVGQTVKISAVDESGAPTAWEPVDFPSGGGASSADVFIIRATADETFTNAQFDKTTEQIYEAYQSGKYCLVCIGGMFVPVESVETYGVEALMSCCGFIFPRGQGKAVSYEFITNDGVTWKVNKRSPVLYNVCFSGLKIFGEDGRIYTISVNGNGNITATMVTG